MSKDTQIRVRFADTKIPDSTSERYSQSEIKFIPRGKRDTSLGLWIMDVGTRPLRILNYTGTVGKQIPFKVP